MPDPFPKDVNDKVKRVFVYGTLREGGSNRHVIANYIETSQPATTHGRMYNFSEETQGGRGWYPYMEERGDDIIVGEMLTFAVGDWETALQQLDSLEGCPDFYYRRVKEVTFVNGVTTEAWIYFMQDLKACQGEHIESGDWIKDNRGLATDCADCASIA